jgi:putative phosphoesterase
MTDSEIQFLKSEETIIGIVSDTHGLLRERVRAQLKGSALIVHAGDFDTPEILEELKKMAPLLAARGNMDRGDWAQVLPGYDLAEIDAKLLCVVHDLHQLPLEPAAAGLAAVICGHTHQPGVSEYKGVLTINPGSAGPRRFGKPLSFARLVIRNGRLKPEIIMLDE